LRTVTHSRRRFKRRSRRYVWTLRSQNLWCNWLRGLLLLFRKLCFQFSDLLIKRFGIRETFFFNSLLHFCLLLLYIILKIIDCGKIGAKFFHRFNKSLNSFSFLELLSCDGVILLRFRFLNGFFQIMSGIEFFCLSINQSD